MKLARAVFVLAVFAAWPAWAQTDAPTPDSPAAPAPETTPKPKPKPKKVEAEPRKDNVASIIGQTLQLNGSTGVLQIVKGDTKEKPLKITTLKLPGEVISNPSQKCVISIVGDGPIELSNEGSPDGLPRFAADVPACPITFDVVGGGVIVPPQTRACVFQAADCQASPSGVWGPNPVALSVQAQGLAKERSQAEAMLSEHLKTLAKRSKGEEEELQREQNDFNALRDETCRAYADESTHGYCDARMIQARVALLRKQIAKAPPKSDEEKPKKAKKKKTDE